MEGHKNEEIILLTNSKKKYVSFSQSTFVFLLFWIVILVTGSRTDSDTSQCWKIPLLANSAEQSPPPTPEHRSHPLWCPSSLEANSSISRAESFSFIIQYWCFGIKDCLHSKTLFEIKNSWFPQMLSHLVFKYVLHLGDVKNQHVLMENMFTGFFPSLDYILLARSLNTGSAAGL